MFFITWYLTICLKLLYLCIFIKYASFLEIKIVVGFFNNSYSPKGNPKYVCSCIIELKALYIHTMHILRWVHPRAGEPAQLLRACIVLPEGWSLFLSTYAGKITCDAWFQWHLVPLASVAPARTYVHMHIHTNT